MEIDFTENHNQSKCNMICIPMQICLWRLWHLRLKEHCRRTGEACKSQTSRVCCELGTPGNFRVCTCKVSPVHQPKHERNQDNSRLANVDVGKTSSSQAYPKDCWDWWRVFPREEHVTWLPKWSAMKRYVQGTVHILSRLHLWTRIYMYMHVY